MAEHKFCVRCGERLGPQYQFCPVCGTKRTGEAVEEGKPISEEAKKKIQDFEAQFQAMKTKAARPSVLGILSGGGLPPRVRLLLLGCSAAMLIALGIAMIFMMNFLKILVEKTNHLQQY